MPYLRHEYRDCAVGLTYAGTPLQKIRIAFVFYYFIILIIYLLRQVYSQHHLAHFLLA